MKLFCIHIGLFFGGLFVLSTIGIASTLIFSDIQIGISYPDSKYVTVINQVDSEKESAINVSKVMEDQERHSKKS